MTGRFAPSGPGAQRITAITSVILDIPLRRVHRFASLSIDKQSILLVRVATSGGLEGVGEGVVPGGPWWGGESVEGMQALLERYLFPALLGEDARQADVLSARLDRLVVGALFAKAGLEMALWDVAAQAAGVPLHQLLGGLHRSELPVTWAIGADPAEDVIAEALRMTAEHGHRAIKLKMGRQPPADDVARVEKICSGLRSRADVAVGIDLNGAWDEPTARRLLPRLTAAGVTLVEQPVPAWNTAALARLRLRCDAMIMADESLRTTHDALRLAAEGAVDAFAVKPAKSGGIGPLRRIAHIAESAGIACYGGTAIESSVGTAAALHAFCATAAVTAGSELFGPLLLADDIVTEPLTYQGGALHPPSAPGLGVTLDEAKVAKYARGASLVPG